MYTRHDVTIVHITDTHVTGPVSSDFGIDLSANLDRVLQEIGQRPPDLLVFTGDLFCTRRCEEYSRTVLERMRAVCRSLLVTPGNHDDSGALARATDGIMDTPPEWPQSVVRDQVRLLLLDTSKNRYGTENLVWVEMQAQEAALSGEQLLIFAHHPPCRMAGMPLLNLYFAPTDAEESEPVFGALASRYDLFCGHYHLQAQRRLGNGVVHITSAVAFTVNPDSETIELTGVDPCLRVIEINSATKSVTSKHVVVRPPT
jgi:3',5'-cyclic AMP phosphodiesterase CpdA